MDTKKPEEMPIDADEEGSPIEHMSVCSGQIVFEGTSLVVTMGWHLDHSIDKETRKQFFKYRCHALADAFGHLKGVTGLRMDADGHWHDHPQVNKPLVGTCGVSLGYKWPNITIEDWDNLALRFIDVFAPASLYGKVLLNNREFNLRLTGEFTLPEKGTS